MAKPFWGKVSGRALAQGDLLPTCLVPQFDANFGAAGEGASETLAVGEQTLIIVTQSCDLENNKVELVALCPAYTLTEFEEQNSPFKQKGRWEEVRKGRIEGLHLLGSPTDPENNRGALVVDFRQIFSLPPAYLEKKRRRRATGYDWNRRSLSIFRKPSPDTLCASVCRHRFRHLNRPPAEVFASQWAQLTKDV